MWFRETLTLDSHHGFLHCFSVLLTLFFPPVNARFTPLCHDSTGSSRNIFNLVKLVRNTQTFALIFPTVALPSLQMKKLSLQDQSFRCHKIWILKETLVVISCYRRKKEIWHILWQSYILLRKWLFQWKWSVPVIQAGKRGVWRN